MLTFTGRKFWPLDPHPDEVEIADIAHGLANTCRFSGQCREFYSVAQHSVLVASLMPANQRLIGLMHDAPESYIGDLVKPLKRELPDYKHVEGIVWRAICQKFRMDENLPVALKNADMRVLMTERRDLMNHGSIVFDGQDAYPPLAETIVPWSPDEARLEFMMKFNEYRRGA